MSNYVFNQDIIKMNKKKYSLEVCILYKKDSLALPTASCFTLQNMKLKVFAVTVQNIVNYSVPVQYYSLVS